MSTSGPNGLAGLWPALDRALTQGQIGRMTLQEAQREQAQKSSSLDALAALLPGITDSKGITWDQARPMDATEQKQTAMKAFPQQAAGALMSQLFPAPPKFEKFAPGEVGGMLGADGKFTPSFTAAPKTEDFKIGSTRDIKRGDQVITEEYQGNGKWAPIGSGRAFAPQTPQVQEFFDEATGRPYKAQLQPDGSWQRVGGISTPAKSFNNEQNLAAGFASRMDLAEQQLGDVSKKYPSFDPTSLIEGGLAATNLTTSEANQLYRQAQENWVTANLRKESGAAIGKDEMDREIKKYFPQAGDKSPLVDQKAQARAAAARAVQFSSGGAYDAMRKEAPTGPGVTSKPPGPPPLGKNGKPMVWVPD